MSEFEKKYNIEEIVNGRVLGTHRVYISFENVENLTAYFYRVKRKRNKE